MLGVLLGLFGGFLLEVIDARSRIALFAFGDQIGELVGVSAGFPDHRMHQNAAIEPDDVVAHLDDALPPGLLDVVLKLDAERAVVVATCQPAVDFARLKYKTTPLTQRHNVLKFGKFCHVRIPK